jgi:hypothetical protein
MGALVTLDLPEDSPVLDLPWIVTFGPADESENWDPVVCGPYERAHAMSIAETVVADEDLLAVVEPVMPRASVDQIREDIEQAKALAESEAEHEHGDDEFDEFDDETGEDVPEVEPSAPPTPEEVRAGFARIASRIAAAV